MVNIYFIKCENGKYYVGKSSNLTNRLEEHENRNAAQWTKKHPMIKVKRIICNKSNWYEDTYTIKKMKKHGIDNVRGGSFCQVKLNENERNIIQRMIGTISDTCFTCGQNDHFANRCPQSQRITSVIYRSYKASEKSTDSDEKSTDSDEKSADSDEKSADSDEEKDITPYNTIIRRNDNDSNLENITSTPRISHRSRGYVRGSFRGNNRGNYNKHWKHHREGNWTCTECKSYNYNGRTTCYSCHNEQDSTSEK